MAATSPGGAPSAEPDWAVVHAAAAHDRALAARCAFDMLRSGLGYPEVLAQVFRAFNAEGRTRVTAADAAEVLARYGGLLGRQGVLEAARGALEASIAIDPDQYDARLDAGTVTFMQADLAAAEAHYAAASALRPDEVEPMAARAAIAARQGDAATAGTLASAALALAPDNATATLALARAELLQGTAAACVARLDALLARRDLPGQNRIAALDLRAEAQDTAAAYPAAFADYAARNALLSQQWAPRIARELPERRGAQAARLAAWFAAADPAPWQDAPPAPASPAAGHAFVLGFPRSGTTLIEKALAGHDRVLSIEELDHLSAATGDWLRDDAALQRLARLDAATAATARADYWQRVEAAAGSVAGKVVIDKLPLHSVALPVISKLFPDARILLALRDPRDVVLSCFRRRFAMNAAMFELLSLNGAAAYYDAVMRLVARCREIMPLHLTELRHEALVADFDAEVGAVLAALGLDWQPAVRDFAARIGGRFRTPSDVQLTRGLTDAGIGQWRHYRAGLAPVLPVLAPWAARFGYPAD